jgi:GNAT superfamily N-acetyltransferase
MIRELIENRDVAASYNVMRQLRPHLTQDDYVQRVARQRREGFRLVAVEIGSVVRAVAGFRIREMLYQGRHLYVDDLVTDEAERSKGYGQELMDWLMALARSEGCATLELDSGVQRFRAHAFYFATRMHVVGYHFQIALPEENL